MVSRSLEGRDRGGDAYFKAASLFVEAVVLPKSNSSQPWGDTGCIYTVKKGGVTGCIYMVKKGTDSLIGKVGP